MRCITLQITIDEVQHLTNVLLSHLRERGIGAIEFSSDYYWHIPSNEVYEPLNKPTNLDIGQLTEDLERLKEIAEGKNDPIGYALVWLSSILRYIGEQNVA